MKNSLKVLVLIFIVLSTFTIAQQRQNMQGQNMQNFEGGSIIGRVLDEASKEPIEYANIVLISQRDSSIVTGTVTDKSGKFSLTKLRPGKHFLDVRFIGYHDIRQEITINREKLNWELGDIFISVAAINIENVVVEGERSPVTYHIDKKVVDVSQIQTAISGTVADVLENVPSVRVDIEGNVSLRGSQSFTVLIDGRPSIMDPQDVLQQVPANSVQSIEIITNPSAKYDPEGTAGIINIIMKKNQNIGLSGIVNANVGLNDKYGADFIVEYKTESINYNFGADYNKRMFPGDSREENIFFTSNPPSMLNSTGNSEFGRTMYGMRGGVEFLLSESDVVTINGRYGSREGKRNSFLDYTSIKSGLADSLYESNSLRTRGGGYYSFATNYFKKFEQKGHELRVEIFYGSHDPDESTTSSEFFNSIQNSGRKSTESGLSEDFRGKLDYSLPLSEQSKFEAGYQYDGDRSDDVTEFFEFNKLSGQYEKLDLFSNNAKYNRNEHSLYSLYSYSFEKLALQGGLRAEYTYRNTDIIKTNESFKIDRWDYFPTFHTSYKFDKGTQLMASYTRRIERPRRWYLEPFITWVDANNVRVGNPGLEPEFIDSYETGIQTFIGKVSVSAEVYYKMTNNKIELIRKIDPAFGDNITFATVDNVGSDKSLGTEFMMIFDPVEFWNVNLMANLYDYRVEGTIYDKPFSRKSFNWSTRLNNVFKLWTSTQFQFNFNYHSPTVSSQGTSEGFFTSDLALKQEFFDRSFSLTLQVRDIFGSAKHESTSEGPNFYKYNYFERESPMVMLTARFNFNNFKQKRDRNGSDERMGGDEEF